MKNQAIHDAIYQYELDQQIASFSPNYKRFLQLEETLKLLENELGNCKDILQKNELNDKIDQHKLCISNFLEEW